MFVLRGVGASGGGAGEHGTRMGLLQGAGNTTFSKEVGVLRSSGHLATGSGVASLHHNLETELWMRTKGRREARDSKDILGVVMEMSWAERMRSHGRGLCQWLVRTADGTCVRACVCVYVCVCV